MLAFPSKARVEYVSMADPAIDQSKFDAERYIRTLDREKYAPLKEGETPTVFSLARLTREQSISVERADPAERDSLRVAYGLKGVTNFQDSNGNPLSLETKGDRLTKDCLDRIYSPRLFWELGQVIDRLSVLVPLSE